MIPVKLALRNFMPYRDNVPPLYFDGIHTASICGDNGNGKSALIDAMTWVLWGKARGKSDDDLIHLGQTEMEVELDFTVGQQLYRVLRKHAQPKRRRASGQTILEFQIATEDGFRPISGNTISQTQQAIIIAIHIDYTTFINSALLLQGRADEGAFVTFPRALFRLDGGFPGGNHRGAVLGPYVVLLHQRLDSSHRLGIRLPGCVFAGIAEIPSDDLLFGRLAGHRIVRDGIACAVHPHIGGGLVHGLFPGYLL